MNITLDYLRGRKIWLVKNFCIWGEYSAVDLLLVHTEIGETSKRIIMDRVSLGGKEQEVNFDSLYDFKGNKLPQQISSPKVLALPSNEVSCMVMEESNSGFKIAKRSDSVENGLVDLLIFELE
ncbi:MAG: hypothetical protein A2W07_01275 [candidate division Zixibacteria bacterium RBG_16_43_9]|jgi:hypothetical protein|nr:MAG: hypothetical protein A2W07_01275 [candidate division Zixibacteria bacterium RBG_16_43_9]